MDDKFTFWYPVFIETQLDFEGRAHNKESYGEGHIVHSGRLMCQESRERLKNVAKAKKDKIVKLRIPKAKMCPVCEEKYKKNLDSAWRMWAEGKPVKSEKELPPLLQF